MGYTLGQAAKAVGMSKTSILRSIKTGRISAGRDEFGQWAIEPCELHRPFRRRFARTGALRLAKSNLIRHDRFGRGPRQLP
jgi:hypothetical protein